MATHMNPLNRLIAASASLLLAGGAGCAPSSGPTNPAISGEVMDHPVFGAPVAAPGQDLRHGGSTTESLGVPPPGSYLGE
jgi:hypothetical protein